MLAVFFLCGYMQCLYIWILNISLICLPLASIGPASHNRRGGYVLSCCLYIWILSIAMCFQVFPFLAHRQLELIGLALVEQPEQG